MRFGGQNITAERGISVEDMPTTDGHGWARKRGVITSYAYGEKSKLSKHFFKKSAHTLVYVIKFY